jgi:hypothetical protein
MITISVLSYKHRNECQSICTFKERPEPFKCIPNSPDSNDVRIKYYRHFMELRPNKCCLFVNQSISPSFSPPSSLLPPLLLSPACGDHAPRWLHVSDKFLLLKQKEAVGVQAAVPLSVGRQRPGQAMKVWTGQCWGHSAGEMSQVASSPWCGSWAHYLGTNW